MIYGPFLRKTSQGQNLASMIILGYGFGKNIRDLTETQETFIRLAYLEFQKRAKRKRK